jgi:hypothetical protein
MDIERDKLRDFILWLWEIMEKRDAELLAYEVTFHILKASGQFPELDLILKRARENPSPELARQHKEARETIERLLAEQNPGDALKTFLLNWKPKGPIH